MFALVLSQPNQIPGLSRGVNDSHLFTHSSRALQMDRQTNRRNSVFNSRKCRLYQSTTLAQRLTIAKNRTR